MDDEHFFPPSASRRERPAAPLPWQKSEAKKLLQQDLMTGRIPLSGHVMGSKAVYDSRPEYASYPFNLFPRRLAALRTEAKSQTDRRHTDEAAYEHGRLLKPTPTHDMNGVPRWAGSAAERLLKNDITDGQHLLMKPQTLYQSRLEYQQFNLTTFRGHIYQEIKRRKFITSYYGR